MGNYIYIGFIDKKIKIGAMMVKNDSNWVVYILECSDGSLYTGITNNLEKRVNAHNDGSGAKYTKGRAPVRVVYVEECADRSEASKRERVVKLLSKAEKLRLFQG